MFDKNFIWGTAASSYQIEGAYKEDGKGTSIWDVFANTPGKTANGENGNIACDHYHRYKDDIRLMHELGIQAYRFSISWPRIFPNGIVSDQELNAKGLAFYDDVVDCCLSYGIKPYITLYHWDLPQVLEDRGGWQNRETAYHFADYAEFICRHFADKTDEFATINEPQIISGLGYYLGQHAPGLKLYTPDVLKVIHHLALAHGLAVQKMRAAAGKPVRISFSSTGNLCFPQTESEADIEAARRASFTTSPDNWTFCHHIFCDMVCLGRYPDIHGAYFDTVPQLSSYSDYEQLEFVKESDMADICQPVDYIGINVYNGREYNVHGGVHKPSGYPRTSLGWPVTPRIMDYGMRFMYERYHLPILITEDGLACNDVVCLDGKVHDPARIDFLTRYLTCLQSAYDSGVPILGYMHWSFLDNFEWHSGYDPRFGLVYVDYTSQERIPKDSAYWYRDLIRSSQNS